jgi:hypothetical protein
LPPPRPKSLCHPHQSKKVRRIASRKAKKGGKSTRRDSSARKIAIISQNIQGLKHPAKLETIINEVNKRCIFAYLVQGSRNMARRGLCATAEA